MDAGKVDKHREILNKQEKPLGLLLVNILNYLHNELRPVSPQELKEKLRIDVEQKELAENLRTNPRIVVEPDGRLRWKSKYLLRNKQDLLSVIRKSQNGIDKADLMDAYKGVEEDLQNLLNSEPKEVLIIKNNFYKQEFVFPFEPRLFYPVSADVTELWSEVRVPDPVDVHRYLVGRGLKEMPSRANNQPERAVVRKRPKSYDTKRRNVGRRAKMTNEHLQGTALDLNQTIQGPTRDSAFHS
eukprot:jgi/Galph1/1771/GphlegSOOS_G461.1